MRAKFEEQSCVRTLTLAVCASGALVCGTLFAEARTCTWTGGGEDNLASTPANWSDATAPAAGDAIVLDGASDAAQKAITWDLDVKVGSWTQQSAYTNTVTFKTVYDPTGFDCFEVAGDVLLNGGSWTHLGNSGTTKTYWLNVKVDGDFSLGASATVNVSCKGYTSAYRECTHKTPGNYGGSYGGFGGSYNTGTNAMPRPYGKFYAPDLPGTAGTTGAGGGGAFKLVCAGAVVIDGKVISNGSTSGYNYYLPSGGSIWLTCGEISGSGSLTARPCQDPLASGAPGSGGRIAVKLTKAGADFSNFNLVTQANAHGQSGYGDYTKSAPGSIYGETSADTPNEGWLIFSGESSSDPNKWSTPFTKDVTYVHVKRLTLVNSQWIRVEDGQTLDLSGTTVETTATGVSGGYGVYMMGGDIAVGSNAFTIDTYRLQTLTGWAPTSEVFTVTGSGKYLPSGAASTMSGNLVVSGGEVKLPRDFTVGGGVSLSGGTLTLNADVTLTVGGNWSRTGGTFTMNTGSAVVFSGSGVTHVSGTTSFLNLTCTTPGKEFEFASGARWNVSGTMTFAGTSDAHLNMHGVDDAQWTLDTSAGAAKVSYADLSDCKSIAVLSVENGKGDNNENVSFVTITPGETVTWTGAAGTGWLNAGNWTSVHDGSRTPVKTDNVVIPAGCAKYPKLSEGVEVASLSVAAGATLSLDTFALTVTGAATLNGEVNAAAGGGLVFGGDTVWTGTTTGVMPTVSFCGTSQTFSPTHAVMGDVLVSAPSLTVNGTMTCATFTVGDGETAQSVLFVPASELTCEDFVVTGDATSKNVALASTVAGTWKLTTRESAVTGADVANCDASGGWMIEVRNSTDSGGNTNWRFSDTRIHYTGGTWPTLSADSELVIDRDVVAELPTEVTALKSLYVSPRARLSISSSLAIDGDALLRTGSTVEWNRAATLGGQIRLETGVLLTHAMNSGNEANRVDIAAAGDITIAAGAKVDVCEKDAWNSLAYNGNSGLTHGGRAYPSSAVGATIGSYGSIFTPTNMGGSIGGTIGTKGSFGLVWAGGGAVHLKSGGCLAVGGDILASVTNKTTYYGSSGGSIWLEAKTLSGSGTIAANGGNVENLDAGAGGRVSIILSEQTTLSPYAGTISAFAGEKYNGIHASAGTVFVSCAGDESLRIGNRIHWGDYSADYDATDVPSARMAADDVSRFANVSVKVYNHGTMNLTQDLRIKNLEWGTNPHLKLNGHVLKVMTRRPKTWPKEGLPSWVVPGGTEDAPGRIEWYVPGLSIIMR